MSELTHLDDSGHAKMVNVGNKTASDRVAKASGRVLMQPNTIEAIKNSELKKGDALQVARIAGIMAAKQTGLLIPLCHPLGLESISVEFEWEENAVKVTAVASLRGKTGVEMEALTAVSVAALTLYDMCKAIDQTMTITQIQLDAKTGGRSGEFVRKEEDS